MLVELAHSATVGAFSNDMIVTLHLELHTNGGAVEGHSMDFFFLLKLYTYRQDRQ